MIEIVVVAVAVGIGGYVVRDLLGENPEPKKVLKSVEEQGSTVLNKVNQQMQDVRERVQGKSSVVLAQEFRAWTAERLTEQPELQSWLTNLSDDAFELLTSKTADYCLEFNIDLNWLVEGRLEKNIALKHGVEKIVIDYCTNCWQAIQIQEDVQSFSIIDAIQQNPTDKKYRELSQKLFTELVKQGLTEQPEVELYTAPDKERWNYIGQAIADTMDKNPKKVNVLLKETLSQN